MSGVPHKKRHVSGESHVMMAAETSVLQPKSTSAKEPLPEAREARKALTLHSSETA